MQTQPSWAPPRWWGLIVLGLVGGLSCSGSKGLNPVEGKVLYKDQPTAGITVTFHPVEGAEDIRTIRPNGLTKEDGTFKLSSGQADGAVAGEYIVTFTKPVQAAAKGKKVVISTEAPEIVDEFKDAYSKTASSAFRVQIKSGMNKLEPFNLK